METAQEENTGFETIQAILNNVAKQQEETKLRMKERDEQFNRENEEQKERIREIDRIVKANAQLIGKLGGRFGEMVEHMVVPDLIIKFRKLGFVFEKAYQNAVIEDRKNNIFAEVDITLENSEKVMLIEVKSKLSTEGITEHIERIQKLRAHADLHGDKRVFLGAVAGIIMTDNEKQFGLKNGFFILEPSGETFKITAPDSPKEYWPQVHSS